MEIWKKRHHKKTFSLEYTMGLDPENTGYKYLCTIKQIGSGICA